MPRKALRHSRLGHSRLGHSRLGHSRLGHSRLRLWTGSLKGQVLLALALALFLAQGISGALLWRGQSQHAEEALDHVLALRVMLALRRGDGAANMAPPEFFGHDGGGFHEDRPPREPGHYTAPEMLEHFAPQQGDHIEADTASRLKAMLAGQDVQLAQLIVVARPVAADGPSRERLADADRLLSKHRQRPPQRLLIAAVQREAGGRWFLIRAFEPPGDPWLAVSLIAQTLLIYLVLVGAMALMLRRITQPLAALTDRVGEFAENRLAAGQIAAQGPDDIRRLIHAHNALEGRIVALLDEKNVMLGAIGHDLKTPLSALRVRIECVEDDVERERMAATIEDIVRTLDDILSLARVGRPSDPVEVTELSALVASVVEEFEDMGEAVELLDTRRIVVAARATWMRRALRNLIGNGLRYGVRVRVSVDRVEVEGAAQARITIEDDGAGIPEGEIARMMEPFTRGEPSRNMATGGAGLGLTLARAIAEQHGGTLALANRRGADGQVAGLVAVVCLPARVGPAA